MTPSEPPQSTVIQLAETTQTNHNKPNKIKEFAIVMGTKVAAGVQNVAALVQNAVLVPVGRAWVAFEEELAENPPPPRNDLIVTGLIGFVAIKAQGDQGFPFRTHPGLFKLSIISLLLYGFASAAQRLLVPIRLRAVACLARGVSLGILVGSLASFFFV